MTKNGRCDICKRNKKLYRVNLWKDIKEHWCIECIKEEEEWAKGIKR